MLQLSRVKPAARLQHSNLRPRAKTWDKNAIMLAIDSTYNRNPMEQNSLIPINTKLLAEKNTVQTGVIQSTYEAETKGRQLAETLMNQIDRYSEQNIGGGGASPLQGFKISPRPAAEPNMPYIGHSGRRVSGFLPEKGKEDTRLAAHPSQIDRIQRRREDLFEERTNLRSVEALKYAIDQGMVEQIFDLCLDKKNQHISKIEEPLVRTNLTLSDFIPQSSFEKLHKIVQDTENSKTLKNGGISFKDDLILTAVERVLHLTKLNFWDLSHRIHDITKKVVQIPMSRHRYGDVIGPRRSNNLTQHLTSRLPSILPPNILAQNLMQMLAMVDVDTVGKKQRVEDLIMLTNLQYLATAELDKHQSNEISKKILNDIQNEKYTVHVYEELLAASPDTTTKLTESGHVKFILDKMFEHNIPLRLQTFNTLMEKSTSFTARSKILKQMENNDISPSIYSYALLYESIFDMMSCRIKAKTTTFSAFNKDIHLILQNFWLKMDEKRFLCSPDKRDLVGIYKMMLFVHDCYIKDIRGKQYISVNQSKTDKKQVELDKVTIGRLPLAVDEANRILNLFKKLKHSELVPGHMQADLFAMYIYIGQDHVNNILVKYLDLAHSFLKEDQYEAHHHQIEAEIERYREEVLDVFTNSLRYLYAANVEKQPLLAQKLTFGFCTENYETLPLVTTAFNRLVSLLGVDLNWNMYNFETDMIRFKKMATIDILRKTERLDTAQVQLAEPFGSDNIISNLVLQTGTHILNHHNKCKNEHKMLKDKIEHAATQSEKDILLSQAYKIPVDPNILELGNCLLTLRTYVTLKILLSKTSESAFGSFKNVRGGLMMELINQLALSGKIAEAVETLTAYALPNRQKLKEDGKIHIPVLQLEQKDFEHLFSALILHAGLDQIELVEQLIDLMDDINDYNSGTDNAKNFNLIIQKQDADEIKKKFVLRDDIAAKLEKMSKQAFYHTGSLNRNDRNTRFSRGSTFRR